MMSNKKKIFFFAVEIQFALGYHPFFIMAGVDTGLSYQISQILWLLQVKKTLHNDFDVLTSY